MEDTVGTTIDRSDQSPKPTRTARDQPPKWTGWKYILRWVVIVSTMVMTIISLVSIRALSQLSTGWTMTLPVFPLPYPVLSLVWEAAELLVIRHKQSKSKGIQPAAHIGCELILCVTGATIGPVWISITHSYTRDSYFTNGESGISGETLITWASITYFWGAVAVFTAVVQFTIFVLSCIEVDRKRRQLEFQVSQIMKVIEDRGGNPEEILRTLQEAPKSQGYLPPVELPAINHNDPAELNVEEEVKEMGDENRAGEMPTNTPSEAKVKYRF